MNGEPTSEALYATPDEDAFSALYRRHEGLGMILAKRYAKTREDAEDIAQEAWMRIHRRRTESCPSALPFTQILAAAVFFGARAHGRKAQPEAEEITEGIADPSASPEAAFIVRQAINGMDDSTRRVFGLVVDQGWTIREAAEMEGISKSAAHRRLGEAMETLERALGRAA